MSSKVKTFESLRDIRPHALREGITARAVEGERMTMWIGDERSDLRPGDTYAIPSQVPHHVVVGPGGCTVLDVFAPVREDWKKLDRLAPAKPDWP